MEDPLRTPSPLSPTSTTTSTHSLAHSVEPPRQAAGEDLDNIKETLSSLKSDVTDLVGQMSRLAGSATGRVARRAEDWATDTSEEAQRLASRVATEGQRSVKAVLHQVEEQPLLSLAIAFAAGIIAGRTLSR